MKKKIALIDAMALAYKAYFAFISRPLKTKTGFPTSAVYGFITQVIKLLEDIRPDYCAVAFDHKDPTFRHKEYKEYKANRAVMPDDLIPQIGKIREVLEVLQIPVLILPGYEADDIVGTLAKKAEALDMEVFMVTPDKDYVQLISDNIKLVKPGKSTDELDILTVDRVIAEYGFSPIQMIDYLALIGDSSDNVPGVKGIGPKGAVPLIQKYSTVENIYEHEDDITPAGTKNKLTAGKDMAMLSKRLVTIDTNTPIELNIEEAKLTAPDFSKVQSLFLELEFRNPYARILEFFRRSAEDNSPDIPEVTTQQKFETGKVKYMLVSSSAAAKEVAAKLAAVKEFVFDTETDSLDMHNINLAGLSVCMEPDEAYFIAVNPFNEEASLFHPDLNDRLPLDDFVKIFKPVFENENIKKICQNGKYDIAVLRNYGIETRGFYFDTMIAGYIIDPEQKVGMDDLSEMYLNYKPIPLSDLIGTKKDAKKIFDVPADQLSNYSAEDADVTFKLYQTMKPLLEKDGLERVAYEVDFPLVEVLEDMERNGIKLDSGSLRQLSTELERQLGTAAQKICSLAGEEFNINSPIQLQKILFDKLGLKATKKTKTGYSTDAQSLEALRGEHDIIDELLSFRQISKIKSTYADALPALIDPKTGRIHTTFNQTVASTGRLSSLDPNLQNIPIRSELGKEIRKAFVPADKNHIILSADYSQIELRIMASMCGDANLVKAFNNGEDIHRSTAALVFMTEPQNVTADMRRKAKEVNFGILYGIGPFGLKTRLGISQQHAKEIIQTYFNTFANVKTFIDDCAKSAREKGYAATLLGRRRFLRNINSNNFVVKQFEERVAVNMPIQGTAADMIKLAMINVHRYMKRNKMKSKMALQVHDELVFDAHLDEINDLRSAIKEIMETSFPLNVPVVVDTGIGDNWLDAH